MTPSPTHDSEDWLLDLLVTQRNLVDQGFYSRVVADEKIQAAIHAHYAHYLKPEDVEAIIGETEIEWKKPKAMTRNDLRREQRERLSKLNREEEKDAKT